MSGYHGDAMTDRPTPDSARGYGAFALVPIVAALVLSARLSIEPPLFDGMSVLHGVGSGVALGSLMSLRRGPFLPILGLVLGAELAVYNAFLEHSWISHPPPWPRTLVGVGAGLLATSAVALAVRLYRARYRGAPPDAF